MKQLMHILSMGGYGRFVWPSYIAMFLIFTISFYIPSRRFRRLKAKVRGIR